MPATVGPAAAAALSRGNGPPLRPCAQRCGSRGGQAVLPGEHRAETTAPVWHDCGGRSHCLKHAQRIRGVCDGVRPSAVSTRGAASKRFVTTKRPPACCTARPCTPHVYGESGAVGAALGGRPFHDHDQKHTNSHWATRTPVPGTPKRPPRGGQQHCPPRPRLPQANSAATWSGRGTKPRVPTQDRTRKQRCRRRTAPHHAHRLPCRWPRHTSCWVRIAKPPSALSARSGCESQPRAALQAHQG